MGASKRVWVIDGEKPASGSATMAQPGSRRESSGGGLWHAVPERTSSLFLSCYLLGPMALLWLRPDRSRFVWAALGLAASTFWSATLWRWDDIARWLAAGRIPFGPWLLGTLVLSGLGIVAWIRAIVLTGMDARFEPQGLPRWLRGPVGACALSLLVPGAGLLATGALGRAALAAWNASVATLAGVLLWKAPWLWRTNGVTHYWPLSPSLLEGVFLVTAALGFVASLGWTASILDSVRCGLQSTRPASLERLDRLTLALLLLVVVACATSEPRLLARDTNEMAGSLEHQGMQYVPLALARLAQHLDPSRPAYALHVAALLDARGNGDAAALVRAELNANWQEYTRLAAATAEAPAVPLDENGALPALSPTTAPAPGAPAAAADSLPLTPGH